MTTPALLARATPETLPAIRARLRRDLRERFPGRPDGIIAEMAEALIADAARHPQAEVAGAVLSPVIDRPQVFQGHESGRSYLHNGRTVQATWPEPEPEPEPEDPDRDSKLALAFQIAMADPRGGRRGFVLRLAAAGVLFSGARQHEVAARLGLSRAAMSRAVESLRQSLETAKPQEKRQLHPKVECPA
ncbi:MAG: hypothetical protein AB9869_37265 [Verrucomicrobiia bacterium]